MAGETDHADKLPGHIAFIMDGNGRWASERAYRARRVIDVVLRLCGGH